ncbi:hypothetical protein GCM10027262_08210 [Nocardia tengchongensis]
MLRLWLTLETRRQTGEVEGHAIPDGNRNERTIRLAHLHPEDVRPELGGDSIVRARDNGVVELDSDRNSPAFVTIPTLDRYKSADRSTATLSTLTIRPRILQDRCADRHIPL